jgi:CRP/FNR family nitrogen fixation transcriptional regulator
MSASLANFTDHAFVPGFLARALPRGATPAPARHAAARHAIPLEYKSDSEIYAEGGAALSVYQVETGVVRTCKYMSDGRRQIDAFYAAGEIFGLQAGAEHELTAEAVSDCVLTVFRRGHHEMPASAQDGTAMDMLTYAMSCLSRARAHSLLLGRGSASQKLAAFLLEMTGQDAAQGVVELAMSRQDIADYLGLTMETISRTFAQFERDDIIVLTTARRIHLKDRAALHRLNS